MKGLVDLLTLALNLKSNDILCTSLDGYRLSAGEKFHEALRDRAAAARVFIGLITASSSKSAFVLFECGARWGREKKILPVVAAGFKAKSLPGPLREMNAMDCGVEGQLHQLVGEVATILRTETDIPSVFQGKIRSLSSLSKRLQPRKKKKR